MANSIKYKDSLAAKRPDLTQYWDKDANQEKHDKDVADGKFPPHPAKPEDVTPGSNVKAFWKFEEYIEELDVTVSETLPREINKVTYYGLPKPSRKSPGLTKDNSLAVMRPDIAKYWDWEANYQAFLKDPKHPVSPWDVTLGSHSTVFLKFDEYIKELDVIASETLPVIVKNVVNRGFPRLSRKSPRLTENNNLAVMRPDIAKYWDWEANYQAFLKDPKHPVSPWDVTLGSDAKVFWKVDEYIKELDTTITDTFSTKVIDVVNDGLPKAERKSPGLRGDNSLAAKYPDILKYWDWEANYQAFLKDPKHPISPWDITFGSHTNVFLKIDEYIKELDVTASEKISAQVNKIYENGIPKASRKSQGLTKDNNLAVTYPDIAKYWDWEANYQAFLKDPKHPISPWDVRPGSDVEVFLKIEGFSEELNKMVSETKKCMLSYVVYKALPKLSLAALYPSIAEMWDKEENQKRHDADVAAGKNPPHPAKPEDVTPGSGVEAFFKITRFSEELGEMVSEAKQVKVKDAVQYGLMPSNVNESRLAQAVAEILSENNIKFEKEKTFTDLKDKSYLPFDFFINDKIVIEVDGMQHFKPTKWSKSCTIEGVIESFKTNIKHDNIKNEYCAKNNIPILRIPYGIFSDDFNPNNKENMEKLEDIILNFIKHERVPGEIFDYYKDKEDWLSIDLKRFLLKNNCSEKMTDELYIECSSNYAKCINAMEYRRFFNLDIYESDDILKISELQDEIFTENNIGKLSEEIFADEPDNTGNIQLGDVFFNDDQDDFSI